MTTIAFDGVYIAADTLIVDSWGLIGKMKDKIKTGKDFFIGFSGIVHEIEKYWQSVKHMTADELINHGHPTFKDDDSGFQAILCLIDGRSYYLSTKCYLMVNNRIHAVGSGRDFALASMYLGKEPREAVIIASHFDNGTSNDAVVYRLKDHPAYIGK